MKKQKGRFDAVRRFVSKTPQEDNPSFISPDLKGPALIRKKEKEKAILALPSKYRPYKSASPPSSPKSSPFSFSSKPAPPPISSKPAPPPIWSKPKSKKPSSNRTPKKTKEHYEDYNYDDYVHGYKGKGVKESVESEILEASTKETYLTESVSDGEPLTNEDFVVPNKATRMMMKQISIDNNELYKEKETPNRRSTLLKKKTAFNMLERTPPQLNIPYNLDLGENKPDRGLAYVVSFQWLGVDAERELRILIGVLRTLKFKVETAMSITKQCFLDMKNNWVEQLVHNKYSSFLVIIIGSSDSEQNFMAIDNTMVSRDEVLHELDANIPHAIPKLFIFNSLVPTHLGTVSTIPKNTLYIHTFLDVRVTGVKERLGHPLLASLQEILRTKGCKEELQEMIRRAKHTCLSTFTNYKAISIRQQSTLIRPLFLIPAEVKKESSSALACYYSVEQAYPVRSVEAHGLAVIGIIEDIGWTQAAKFQKSTRSTYNNLKTGLEMLNLKVHTLELPSKMDYKNKLLKTVRQKQTESDVIFIIIMGTCVNEKHFKFRVNPESILMVAEIIEDLQNVAPDRPKLLFISQLLHLDSRMKSGDMTKANKMQDEKVPYIHNSFILHAKNKSTNSIEGTFLGSFTDVIQSKFRKLEFTKVIANMRLVAAEKNLLPHFLELNNLESPLYMLPEELKISAELLSRGEEFAGLYQEALDDGLELLRFYRLMVVGPEGVGKTSLLRALTGKPFKTNQASTPFIDKFDVQIHKINKNWEQNEDLNAYADRLLDTKEQMAVNYVVGKLKENKRKESNSDLFGQDVCPLDFVEFCLEDQCEDDDDKTPNVADPKPTEKVSEASATSLWSQKDPGITKLEEAADDTGLNSSFTELTELTENRESKIEEKEANIESNIISKEVPIPPPPLPSNPNLDFLSSGNSMELTPIVGPENKEFEKNNVFLEAKIPVSIPDPPPDLDSNRFVTNRLSIPDPPPEIPSTFQQTYIPSKSEDPSDDVVMQERLDLKENLIDIPINKIFSTLNENEESRKVEHPDFLTAWDFAGQNYLYCFHSLFLSPRAIYLLLIDLAVEDLNEPINIREERKDRLSQRSISGVPKTYLEAVEFWLNAIYSVARMPLSEHYSRHSKIVFVFSRADKCVDPVARATKHFETIQDYMIGRSNAFSLVHLNINEPIVLSCKPGSPYLKNVAKIKDLLEEISDTVAFRQEIPIRWLELARSILHEVSPFISHRRLELLCEKHGCTKDFEPLISLFHDIGFFFYQKGIVIRDIQTFLNIIYHVISPQYGDKILAKAKEYDKAFLKQDLLDCQNAGRITSKLLNQILLLDDDISHVREEVIQLLLTYGVIIDSQAEVKHPFYYVPYLMTGNLGELQALDEDINTDSRVSVDARSSQTYYLYFPDGFIPAAVYFSLLSQCLKFNKLKGQPQPLLGFDCARFQLSHDHSFILDFCSNKSYIRILFNSSLTHSYHLTERLNFLHFIQTHVSEIQGNIIPCGNAAKIAVECRCCELYKSTKLIQPCVFLDQLLSTAIGYRTSWCHTSQKYEEWNHLFIDNDFYYEMLQREFDSDDLSRFIFENLNVFEEHINIMTLSRQLYFAGLFTANDLSMLLSKDKNESMTAESILAQLLHQSNNWAFRFYLCLQRETTHSGHLFLVQFIDAFLFKKRAEQRTLSVDSTSEEKRKRFADLGSSLMPSDFEDDFDRYKMNSNPHGVAMIINVEKFQDDPAMTRRGSHHDFIKLRETFEELQYVVLGFEDLTRKQFKKQLINVRKMDHAKYDSFICVIMSHGDESDNVVTHDKQKISKEEIINEFSPDYCPGLTKKPKLFIFQACRGSKNEGFTAALPDIDEVHSEQLGGFEGNTVTDELYLNPSIQASIQKPYEKSITVHHLSDTFIGNSTVHNYVSYRDPSKGSMFIQSFCKVVQYTRYEEFQHIMNEVRRRVSMLSKKYVQCTEDINHLTAKLYFF